MMEQFRRYFDMFSTVYIQEDGLSSAMYDVFSTVCSKLTKLTLSEFLAKKERVRCHFAVIELSKATVENLAAIFAKLSALDTLIVCGNKNDPRILDIVLSYNICGVLDEKPSQNEIAQKLKTAAISLASKQKEKSKNDNYLKFVEFGSYLFCIKRDKKIVFANTALLSCCNANSVSELNTATPLCGSLLDTIFKIEESEDNFYTKTESGEAYLVGVKSIQTEQIITCAKMPSDVGKCSDSLSHAEFVELLKNTLIHKNATDTPVFAVAIKLENAQKIVNDFGSEFFYDYFKKFSSFCGFFFGKEPFVFWYFDYLVILPEEHDVVSVEATAEQLFAQSGQFKNDKDIAPFIDLSVLTLGNLGINDSIALIEKVYAKNLTQAQSAKVCLTKSSTTVLVADGQMAMYHIQNAADKDYKIKLLNIYKGLSVSSSSKIIKITDEDIFVQTEKLQKYLMHTEKSVIIQSEHIPKEIFAEVKYVDVHEPYAILRNPLFLEFSANNRKSVRVQCDARIPITLKSSKYTFTGEIFDISMQAIAVRYKNTINGDIVGSTAKLSFSLPSKEAQNGIAQVMVEGQITLVKNIDDQTRVITSIKADRQNEAVILEYIYLRQKELITEIKKLGGMIFK